MNEIYMSKIDYAVEVEKWEDILVSEGLGIIERPLESELKRAGLDPMSIESAAETEFRIKQGLDDAVDTENIFSSEIPLNKSGLPPCQRVKLENERNIHNKDSRLDK